MATVVSFSTVSEMFDKITTLYADDPRPMLLYKVEKQYRGVTYKEYRRNVELFALGLASLGVAKDDKLAIISENRPEWVVTDMAMVCLGTVNVPIYPTLTPKQIEFIFNDSGVKIAVVSNAFQLNKVLKIKSEVKTLQHIIVMNEKDGAGNNGVQTFSKIYERGAEYEKSHPAFFQESMKRPKPEDLLTIIYTSGTTGNPKGVMLTHRNMASNVQASASVIPFTREDTLLSFL
ncbi:MAG TPA: AMP-binding protein, partial [Bacteroidota bacterium]